MNRRERDHDNYNADYSGYQGYSSGDEHYHHARNITNDFERDYQRSRGSWNDDAKRYSRDRDRSFHEGDMGDAYERMSRRSGSVRSNTSFDMIDRNRYGNYDDNYNRDRDRYSNYQDDYRSYQNTDSRDRGYRGVDMNDMQDERGLRGNIRQGYGISSFEGTSDRFNTLNSDQNRGGAGDDQPYYGGMRGAHRNSGYGSGIGESFPGSNRGVPDTTYGLGNYGSNYGTGMGSSYGGTNYGGGTGYQSGQRGGSFGNSSYGSSSGNYGGTGAMGGGTLGAGRGSTSHNSDRGVNELGGF